MKRIIVIVIVIGILAVVFLAPIFQIGFVISGYGGLESTVYSVEEPHDSVESTITLNTAHVESLWTTDLTFELGQPQFRSTEITYSNTVEETTDNGDVWVRDWEVRIAYFDLGCTVRTRGPGWTVIGDITFWVEIKQNEYNVFQDADEVQAYVLEIVTVGPAEVSAPEYVEVSPTAGGFSFDMQTVSTVPIPDWMTDSGYQATLSDLTYVKIPLNVVRMSPYFIPLVVRAEQQATWNLEIRSLVFGFWEVLSPYDPWIPGDIWEGWFPWIDDLFLGLQLIIGAIFGLIVTVAIVKIPIPPFAKIVGLGVLWVAIFVVFGGVALLGT